MHIQYTVWDMAIVRAGPSTIPFVTACRSSCCLSFSSLPFAARFLCHELYSGGLPATNIFGLSLHLAYGAGAYIEQNNTVTTFTILEYVQAQQWLGGPQTIQDR